MTNARFFFAPLAAVSLSMVLATGCSMSHTMGDDGGRALIDAPFRADAGFSGACGEAVCSDGWVCCNAECGICAPPGAGCPPIVCSDAGPEPRSCGGFAELECPAGEICDFPDGSFCGGDDSGGVCIPRPGGCREPGGVPVCGCDGRDYFGECDAHFSGTDVAHFGSCAAPSDLREASARRTCAPTDGAGWSFTLTSSRASCGEIINPSLTIDVWRDLEREPAGVLIPIELGSFEGGQAYYCDRPDAPCIQASGWIRSNVFAAGEVARFDYEVTTTDGVVFSGTNLEVARWWCDLGSPGCG